MVNGLQMRPNGNKKNLYLDSGEFCWSFSYVGYWWLVLITSLLLPPPLNWCSNELTLWCPGRWRWRETTGGASTRPCLTLMFWCGDCITFSENNKSYSDSHLVSVLSVGSQDDIILLLQILPRLPQLLLKMNLKYQILYMPIYSKNLVEWQTLNKNRETRVLRLKSYSWNS